MTLVNEETLDEILQYMDLSIKNLAKDAFENLEIHETRQIKSFLESQYDIRLENLVAAKNASIHHLESATKNKIIQRKGLIIDNVCK